MPKVALVNMQGAKVGEVELSESTFGAEINETALHTVVRAQLNAKRQGTQSAKTRSEVRGGGRKIYRQKGTGNARHHSRRAPQFTHGGMVFAPKPRDYSFCVPRKVKRLAMKSALTSKVQDGEGSQGAGRDPQGADPDPGRQRERQARRREHPGRHRGVHRAREQQPERSGHPESRQIHRDARRRESGRGGVRIMKSPYDIILRPVLTEKSYDGMNDKKYTFEVAVDAGKTEIKMAVETIFGVKVKSVNTMRVEGKMKRQGRTQGRRPERKKAYVTLTEASKGIEFFEGMAQ